MSKSNGKDDGFENVDGNATTTRARKVAKAFAPSKAPKDQYLPGTQPKTIPTVHAAIEEYVDAEEKRADAATIAKEKKAHLVVMMKKHDITNYAVDGHYAEIETDEKVTAHLAADEQEEKPTPELRGGQRRRARRGAEARA